MFKPTLQKAEEKTHDFELNIQNTSAVEQQPLAHQGKYATNVDFFFRFSGPWKNWPEMAQMKPGFFFPTNLALPNDLGDMDFDLENQFNV